MSESGSRTSTADIWLLAAASLLGVLFVGGLFVYLGGTPASLRDIIGS